MSHRTYSGFFDTMGIVTAALAAYREGWAAANRQEFAKAIEYYSDALEFDGTPAVFRARAHEYRGQCYWFLTEFDAAEQDYRAALTASDDDEQIARAQICLGELADFRGNYEEATSLYRQALATGMKSENLLVTGRARRGLGVLNRQQGNAEMSVNHLTQALAALRQVGEAREQAHVLNSLGRTRHAQGRYQEALTAHGEALTIFESLNDRWRVIQSLNNIGECHQALFDLDNAVRFHERALQLADEHEAQLLKPEIERNIGVDLVEQERHKQGLIYLRVALAGARGFGYRALEALVLYNLADAYLRLADVDQAEPVVSALSELAEELDADHYRVLGDLVRAELLFQKGDVAAAVAELNAAMLAAQTSVGLGVLWKLHARMSQIVANEAVATVHRNIAAEFIRQTAEPLQDMDLKSAFLHASPVSAVLEAAGINPASL